MFSKNLYGKKTNKKENYNDVQAKVINNNDA